MILFSSPSLAGGIKRSTAKHYFTTLLYFLIFQEDIEERLDRHYRGWAFCKFILAMKDLFCTHFMSFLCMFAILSWKGFVAISKPYRSYWAPKYRQAISVSQEDYCSGIDSSFVFSFPSPCSLRFLQYNRAKTRGFSPYRLACLLRLL